MQSLSISLEDSYSFAVTIPAHPPPPISPAVPKSPYSPLSTFSTFHPIGQDRTSPEGSSCGELKKGREENELQAEDSEEPGGKDEEECLYAKVGLLLNKPICYACLLQVEGLAMPS